MEPNIIQLQKSGELWVWDPLLLSNCSCPVLSIVSLSEVSLTHSQLQSENEMLNSRYKKFHKKEFNCALFWAERWNSMPSHYGPPSLPRIPNHHYLKQMILLLKNHQKVNNSLSLCHNVHVIYLTSSHYVGILSSSQEEGWVHYRHTSFYYTFLYCVLKILCFLQIASLWQPCIKQVFGQHFPTVFAHMCLCVAFWKFS